MNTLEQDSLRSQPCKQMEFRSMSGKSPAPTQNVDRLHYGDFEKGAWGCFYQEDLNAQYAITLAQVFLVCNFGPAAKVSTCLHKAVMNALG
jgi:hypothetical protein